MSTSNPTKREILSAIRARCSGCENNRCSFYRFIPASIGQQVDIFQETDVRRFTNTVVSVANKMKSNFLWSELRSQVEKVAEPVHANFWGAAARWLVQHGYANEIVNIPSKYPSRHGALDRVWFKR